VPLNNKTAKSVPREQNLRFFLHIMQVHDTHRNVISLTSEIKVCRFCPNFRVTQKYSIVGLLCEDLLYRISLISLHKTVPIETYLRLYVKCAFHCTEFSGNSYKLSFTVWGYFCAKFYPRIL